MKISCKFKKILRVEDNAACLTTALIYESTFIVNNSLSLNTARNFNVLKEGM